MKVSEKGDTTQRTRWQRADKGYGDCVIFLDYTLCYKQEIHPATLL
jgi:hypothetical protein